MRIDARLVDVATGEVYMGEEITGQKSTFFELEKQLVEKLIATLNLELSRTEKRNLSKVQTESFDSFNAYSSALVAYDDGNIEESIKYLEKATEADEAFDKAWEKLEILEQRLTDLLKARELGMGPMLIDLIDRVSNKDKESLSELITTCGSLMTTYTGIALGWYGENSETLNKNDKFDEANINETLKQEIERVNNKFYSKYFQAINFYKQVIDIAKSNGLLYEKWYASTVEEILYFYYIMALNQSNTVFINYHDTYYGIPEAIPNIVDSNGKIIVKSENINKILIKIGTEMMEKYPVGIYFTTFKIYVEDAIKNEKKKREK